ncbi:DUF4177 domain-containing protein [Methanohalophilus sp.]|uniref:DUF4177 domain-containing protein n=1 Tax=Methanohalophilus sp. TaxID=1966352 RepID=UPI00261BA0B0|nr:DUF4177 domain-containing protein [Methanohalophilus sp.]MDK2892297.1 hypothetical protein [Methanohalophilus sp.]
MTCWEYEIKKIRTGNLDQTKEDLNSMGLEGWELVKFVTPINSMGITNAFFKRPVDEANC